MNNTYKNNGKIYDIPSDREEEFERKYPLATVAYSSSDGKIYDIPVSKREEFLHKYADAKPYNTDKNTDTDGKEAVEGFFKGMKIEGVRAKESIKSAVAEGASSYITGSKRDYIKARETLSKLDNAGYDLDVNKFDDKKAIKDFKSNEYNEKMEEWRANKDMRKREREKLGWMDAIKHKLNDPAQPQSPFASDANAYYHHSVAEDAEYSRVFRAIKEALEESEGDINRAYTILESKSSKDTWGDKVAQDAQEEIANLPQTKGKAAWAGGLTTQMLGNAASIASSFFPATRWLAKPLAAANIAALTTSSAGSSMSDARLAGASDKDVHNAGYIAMANESITEALPAGRYLANIQRKVAKKLTKDVAEKAIASPAAKNELEHLLAKAAKELPRKLINGKNAKEYAKSIITEGGSEAAAGFIETFIPMIYEDEENYPTLKDALKNGWEGAKGGAFMGGILGAGSTVAGHYANRNRRKKQGNIMLADTENGVVEIVGEKDDDTMFALDGNGMPLEIKTSMIIDSDIVGFEEFDNYCKNQTKENLDIARESGRELVNGDAQAKREAKEDYERELGKFYKEKQDELEAVDNPLDYIVEHYEQAEVIIPFFNAKSKLDGMIDGIADDIDSQVSRKLKEIDEITHESGNIYTVKMFGNEEQQANLVRGDITVGEDGAIDLSNSSNFVFVKQNGEIKMVSPREIVSIDNVVNANEYKIFSEEKLRDYLVNNAKQEIEPDTDTDTEPDTEQYNISDEINVNGVNGIISQKNAEGKYIVQFEDKIEIDGVQQRAFELSAEEITNLTTTNNNNGPVVQEVIPEPLQEDVQQQQEEPLQEDVQQLEDKQLEAIPLTKSGKVDYKLLLDNNPELFAKKWEERPGVGEDGTIQYLNNYSKKLGEEIEKKKNKIDNVLDPNILSSIEDDILDLLTRKKKIETLLATRYSPARESQQEIKKSGLSKYQEDVNSLISSVRAHNAQTPGRKLKANVTGINRRANNLGFVIRQNRGDITVFDQDGKEIKRLFGRRQSRAEIESHKKLDDYDDIIISAVKDVYAAPNAILNSNAWTSGRDVFIQGLNDAINGVKSAAANDVLDTIDSAYKNGLTYGDGELVQETYSTLREAVKFDNESVYNEFDDIEKIDDIQVVTNNNSVDLELENDIATEEVDNITDLEDMPEWILDGYNSEEEFKQSQEILNLERKELNLQNKTESNVRTSINTTPEGYSETLPPPEGVRVQESKDTNTERNDERRRDEEVSSKIAQEAEVDGNRYQFAKTNVRSEPITETTEALFSAENKSDSALTNVDLPQKIDKKDVSIFETAENVLKNEKVNKAEKQVNQNQTDGQKKAGNYKKGHVKLLGYDITIENPKGSERSGVDSDGTPWSITMNNTYGYFKGTKGKDGDHIDTFLGENLNSEKVFVVDQLNSDKSFDEHKVMLGFDSIEEAKEAYLSNYEENWQGLGNITETTLDNFKKWTDVKTRKQKPFADYTMNSSNDASNVYGIGNKIVSTDRYAELKKKLRSKLGQLNAGFDPEIFAIGAEMAAYHIEAGTRKFADFSKRMYSDMGEAVVPYLKSFYQGAQAFPGMEDFAKETDNSEIINNFDYKLLSNVHNTTGDSKRDSGDVSVEQQSNARPILSQRREGGRNRNGATGDSSKSIGRDSSEGDSSLYATIFGEPGDNRVHRADQAVQSPGDDAGDTIGTGGSVDGTTGLHDDAAANGANDTDATRVPGSFAERSKLKLELQHKAESITNTSICDLTNIEETLPFLLPEQHGDVLKAENRFFSDSQKTKELANGKGMLFTNGTGTGKTYTGLGIIKRFVKQNVKDILIVVPTQPKVTDWIKDGKNLLLDISPLEDTSSSGEGINITTYANLRSNQELMKREFGLVVYDESHRLMEDKNGGQSSTTLAHYKITNKDRNNALQRLQSFHPLWTESKGLLDKLDAYSKEYNSDEISGERGATIKNEKKTIDTRLIELRSLQEEVLPELEAQADKAVEKTKTVFLSATPFKSHFNLRYANGYLFDWGNEESYQGHSRVDAESRFFLDNFGSAYEWKYHRMQQKSKANSDAIALQEVQFAERLMTSGVMSGRTINSDKDYSREFPRVNGLNTDMFNKAFSDIFNYTENKYSWLREGAKDVFYNYNYSTQFFEALKTSMSIPRMQKHLELGRKVVVFHRRKQSNVMPPFNSILSATRNKAKALLANEYVSPEQKEQADAILSQADTFEASNKELLEYEQTLNYSSAIAQIQEAFGDRAVYINGDVSKNNKDKAIKQFNADDSSIDLIVIQEESGKEGISLHDTSGKHQRVLMNMSMPVSSITALQIEGRIYRIGQETDAIFEYPLLGLDMEIEYFGRNINKRLSTTENLAVGEQSRDLIRSFADGVISESEFEDPHVAQGKGGKEMDRKMQSELSEYRKAVLVYHSNQKNRFKRSQREGNDYYATPEPIGQKMVEWLNLKKDDSVMEPSAGHGAIAMWFPNWVNSTAIEPSFSLYSKLNAKAGGGDRKILNTTFEEFNIINKFNGIAMNPPFGSGGATAISHIEKAFHHLKNGGRLVAIVPNGGSMQKRLDKFLFGENDKGKRNNPDAVLVQEVILPGVTFEQAGTNVNCKVVIIDKIPVEQQQSSYSAQIDLSYAKNVGELFDKLEVIYVPARQQLAAGAQNVVETDFITKIKIDKTTHTKTGADIFIGKMLERVDNEQYNKIAVLAKKNNGYWSSFSKGFLFQSEEDANKFADAVNGVDIRFRSNPITKDINNQFNKELQQQIDGTLPKGHIYKVGNPGNILLSAGIPNLPIELTSERLFNKSKQDNHPFDMRNVANLPDAIQNPIAVFDSKTQLDSKVILTELSNGEKNYIVAIKAVNKFVSGERKLIVNEIKSLYPKDTKQIVKWIEQENLTRWVNKEKVAKFLNIRQSNSADDEQVSNNFRAANIVQKFNNPTIEEGKMIAEVENISQTLNTPVEIIRDIEQVPASGDVTLDQKKRGAKGYYDTSTGKVTIILPNATSIEDVKATMLHEIVTHKGLRELLGEHFKETIDNIYFNADKSTRGEINNLIAKNGWDYTLATEEYMASIAEKTNFTKDETTFWQKIKDVIKNMLSKIGIHVNKINNSSLRSILKNSYDNLSNNGLSSSDKVVYNNSQVYFRDEDTIEKRYEERIKEKSYRLTETYQDSMLGLKVLQDIIEKESGKKIEDYENAYLAENQLSSKNTYEFEFYNNNYFKPLLQSIYNVMNIKKCPRTDITKYMYAKSGLERNKVFAMRDAKNKYAEKTNALEKQLKDKEITEDKFNQELKKINSLIERAFNSNSKHDYSGLSELMGVNEFTDAAKELVKEFEDGINNEIKDLWSKTNKATKYPISKSYEGGLMTKRIYESISNMFEYYIPMRGFLEDTAADVYDYILSDRSPFNSTVVAARGRKSVADDPIAMIGNMAESAIMAANRNKMKQCFLNLALNHTNNLVTVKDMWYINNGTEEYPLWEASIADTSGLTNPNDIEDVINEHQKMIESLAKDGRAIKSSSKLKLKLQANKKEQSEHAVIVKSAGREYIIYVNGNPRAAQGVNGLTNPDGIDDNFVKLWGKMNRQLAANFTTRNPAFVVSNLTRDIIYATTAVSIKENAEYSHRFRKNISSNVHSLFSLLKKFENGTLDMSNEKERLFHEFLENGGETGHTALHNIDKYKKIINKQVNSLDGKVHLGSIYGFEINAKGVANSTINVFKAMANSISFMNRCAEDVSRFTAYQTSRQSGRSIVQSVNDAKEVTVNFNRKGAGRTVEKNWLGSSASFMKGCFLFFNVSMQGLSNFKELSVKNKKKFVAAIAGFGSMGFLLPLLNSLMMSMFGDDEDKDKYNNLPEWIRRNNFVIWTGGDTFITIPLSIELRVFYGLGEIFYQTMQGNMKNKNISYEILGHIADLLPINPFGNGGFNANAMMPDIVRPIMQVITNEDFFGKPIFKNNDYNKNMPEYQRIYSGTSKVLTESTKFLNDITGGDAYSKGSINLNPGIIEHIFESYLGGMAKTFNHTVKTIYSVLDKDTDFLLRNTPVVNRFLQSTNDRNALTLINEDYYYYLREYNQTEYKLKGYEKDVDNGIFKSAEKIDFLYNSKEYKRYEIIKSILPDIKNVNNELKLAVDPDDRKYLQELLNLFKKELVDEINLMEGKK